MAKMHHGCPGGARGRDHLMTFQREGRGMMGNGGSVEMVTLGEWGWRAALGAVHRQVGWQR